MGIGVMWVGTSYGCVADAHGFEATERGGYAAGFTGAEVVPERAGDGPADRHRYGAPNN